MDFFIAVVVLGCALAGGFWGAVRLSAWIVALAAAGFAGRWAGPAAASLLTSGSDPPLWARIAGVTLVAAVAAGLVLVAGRGLRHGLEKARLGCADRFVGALAAGSTALALAALLLALAGESGYSPQSRGAQRLQQVGRDALKLHHYRADPPHQL